MEKAPVVKPLLWTKQICQNTYDQTPYGQGICGQSSAYQFKFAAIFLSARILSQLELFQRVPAIFLSVRLSEMTVVHICNTGTHCPNTTLKSGR